MDHLEKIHRTPYHPQHDAQTRGAVGEACHKMLTAFLDPRVAYEGMQKCTLYHDSHRAHHDLTYSQPHLARGRHAGVHPHQACSAADGCAHTDEAETLLRRSRERH